MATPKVFVTGVTGYVGGDALFRILEAHPDWLYTFLVRDRKRVASFVSRYPKARIITGDVSDVELIKREATAADIILTFHSSDDVESAEAVSASIRADNKVRFWIHTSGSADLLFHDQTTGIAPGELNPKVWDDIADIEAINQWPEDVLHRPVEKIALEASDGHPNVKSAVICPPAIVGTGRGPGNQRTIQVPILIELIRRRKRAFQIGSGEAVWNFVHIFDLSELYLQIVNEAAAGGANADWGRHGWYFAENGERAWGGISRQIAERLCEAGLLPTTDVDSLDAAEAAKIGRMSGGVGGGNSRSRSSRARQRLNWKPRISDIHKCIDEQITEELKASQSRLDDFGQGHMPKTPAPRKNKL